jgi:hypothetical protein
MTCFKKNGVAQNIQTHKHRRNFGKWTNTLRTMFFLPKNIFLGYWGEVGEIKLK